MEPQPQIHAEHQWLGQLVGEWTFTSECIMGPDQPPVTSTGQESVRSLGGLWTITEGGGSSSGGPWKSIMTLGFDPTTKKFVGTFIASMMTHLWKYTGTLDETGRVLTLDTEGPNFASGSIVPYQDIIEIVDADNRMLSSRMLGENGTWIPFMKAHYKRKA